MKTAIIFLCVIIAPRLAIALGVFISARQASAADRHEETELDGTDGYLVSSAQSIMPAAYPKTARISDMQEPMGY